MHRRRTDKHKCRKPNTKKSPSELDDSEYYGLYFTLKGLKHLTNFMLDDESNKDITKIDRATHILNVFNDLNGNKSSVVLCAMCAAKIGIQKCAGCPKHSKIRYCSRACQVADWPVHRISCGVNGVSGSHEAEVTVSDEN